MSKSNALQLVEMLRYMRDTQAVIGVRPNKDCYICAPDGFGRNTFGKIVMFDIEQRLVLMHVFCNGYCWLLQCEGVTRITTYANRHIMNCHTVQCFAHGLQVHDKERCIKSLIQQNEALKQDLMLDDMEGSAEQVADAIQNMVH